MTLQTVQDIVGYLGSQVRAVLVVIGTIATALIGESASLGLSPLEHRCLVIVSIVGSSVAAYTMRPYQPRDAQGNYPPKPSGKDTP